MFVYQADTYCDSCGERIAAQLTAEGLAPEDPSDEYSFDSDDFPKAASEEPTDGPDHCAMQGLCLEGVRLEDYGLASDAVMVGAESPVIGALLSDGLTDHGVSYLAEMLSETDLTAYQVALHTYWRETFASELDSYYEEAARKLGADHGRAAASWYFDGNTPTEAYRLVLAGIEEGDPAVLDTFPSAPLSGEWADDPTPASVLQEIGLSDEDESADGVLWAYEDAFSDTVHDEIERAARYQLEGAE